MKGIWLIALDTFQEALRRKILVAALAVVGLFLVLYTVGLYFVRRELSSDVNLPPSVSLLIMSELLILGLWAASFIIFLSAGIIRNDVEQGYVHVLLARPLSRAQFVVGRWLGLAIMTAVLTSAVAALLLLATGVVAGYRPSQPLLVAAFLTVQPLVLLSMGVLGSVLLPSVGNGIVVFVLFMIGMMGGVVEQIGYLARHTTLSTAGKVVAFLIPTDIPWRQAVAYAQPDVLSTFQVASPFSAVAPPTVWMDLYLVLYSLFCLALASLTLSYKDL